MSEILEDSEDKKQLDFYDDLVTQLRSMIRKHIHKIYAGESLTPNNRTILKNFYFEHIATPAARAVCESYFPKRIRSIVPPPPDPTGDDGLDSYYE